MPPSFGHTDLGGRPLFLPFGPDFRLKVEQEGWAVASPYLLPALAVFDNGISRDQSSRKCLTTDPRLISWIAGGVRVFTLCAIPRSWWSAVPVPCVP
jgi:hypothetical protein